MSAAIVDIQSGLARNLILASSTSIEVLVIKWAVLVEMRRWSMVKGGVIFSCKSREKSARLTPR